MAMHIISKRTLAKYWEQHPELEGPLKAWHDEVRRSTWETPLDVTAMYGSASIIANNRVVFDIKGNAYRLVVAIHYWSGTIYIRFIGTHSEYDQIDATTI